MLLKDLLKITGSIYIDSVLISSFKNANADDYEYFDTIAKAKQSSKFLNKTVLSIGAKSKTEFITQYVIVVE